MTTQHVPTELIDPNPWQTRLSEDPQHVQGIADSIISSRDQNVGDHGLWAPLLARKVGERYQLPSGMTRFAAWKIVNPGVPFPVEVVELSDRQMSDLAAEENAKRKNLSAIEKAHAIQRRMVDFGLTQLEAGAPFGYKDQSSVSNLLRLLQLPEPLQTKVDRGELAENVARRFLPVARIASPKQVGEITKTVLNAAPEDREEALLEEFDDVLRKKARRLEGVPWELNWPKEPIRSDKVAEARAGEPTDMLIPSCRGCESYVQTDANQWCTRDACYQLKARLFAQMEAVRLSKQTGIAVNPRLGAAAPTLIGMNYAEREWAKKCLESKKAQDLLQLVPLFQFLGGKEKEATKNWDAYLVTGSNAVALGTTDLAALKKLVSGNSTRTSTPTGNGESKSAQEAAARAQAAKEHRAESRAKRESARLVAAAVKVMHPVLPKGILLQIFAEVADTEMPFEYSGIKYERTWQSRDGALKKLSDSERQVLVLSWLLDQHIEPARYGKNNKPVGKVRDEIGEIARQLKVKLPKDWDSAATTPHLRENGSCWHCGCMTQEYGARELIQADLDRGWIAKPGVNNKAVGDILCPECAQAEAKPAPKKGKR